MEEGLSRSERGWTSQATWLFTISNTSLLLYASVVRISTVNTQLTKEALFPAIGTLKECLQMTHFMLQHVVVNPDILSDKKYSFLFSVEEVNTEVLKGVPFREAYRKVAEQIEKNEFNPETSIHHTHVGSISNLCNLKIVERFKQLMQTFQ